MKRQVAGGEQDRRGRGVSRAGGAPVEEVPGPEPEEVVKMEPQDQMSEGRWRRTQIQSGLKKKMLVIR